MREKVYGWYPAAYNTYDNPLAKQFPRGKLKYEKEVLYRHWRSQANHGTRGVTPPQPPTPIRIKHEAMLQRPASHVSSTPRTPVPNQAIVEHYLRIQGGGAKSAPPPQMSLTPGRPKAPTPSKKHGWVTEATPIRVGKVVAKAPTPDSYVEMSITQPGKNVRVKSATIRREVSKPPQRPVKSAGPVRPRPSESALSEERFSQPPSDRRPHKPVPPTPTPDTTQEHVEVKTPTSMSYDEVIEKYGWRAEVQGDPYGIKNTVLPERLAYTIKCPEPEIPPNPLTGQMQNYDTFFYNTIPRKPLSCVVHPEWISEVLQAKRIELAKKESGKKYRHTNYAFLY
ncbi:uncharacterized protein LOC106171985 [Lingula anatina]|uniref:Uncharacterized protein LOC106171985 n=1 Tax=Lingula anatina TaxID=7574 RepID=A0A1S3JC41_LINAN|nr:uncharacterized protein LOC106171985 [Lingula anatina]|eukprot:XP_013407975.1 uncharacterized protein LOC106171985 [Lingula anatina]